MNSNPIKYERLDDTLGISIIICDGKVIMSLWLASRKQQEDPLRIEMSAGEAIDLIAKIAPAVKAALQQTLKG